jgi:hypothetical protein
MNDQNLISGMENDDATIDNLCLSLTAATMAAIMNDLLTSSRYDAPDLWRAFRDNLEAALGGNASAVFAMCMDLRLAQHRNG